MLVSSVPLSLTISRGLPRRAIRASSSRATRCPESDVAATRHRHSRLKSSTTASILNRRLFGKGGAPLTKVDLVTIAPEDIRASRVFRDGQPDEPLQK
jgi:hypothetical protein